MMRCFFLFVFFGFFCLTPLQATVMSFQETEETLQPLPQKEVLYDTETLEGTPLDKSAVQKYKEDLDFNYTEIEPEDNWWTRFLLKLSEIWQSFLRWLTGGGEATGILGFLLRLLPYLLVLGLLALLVWIFMKIDNPLISEQLKANQTFIGDDEEIIKNQDIQSLINKALADGNYRLAVRYYYLFTLQQLSGKELIDWQVQKTNHEYIYEIKDTNIRKEFSNVTDIYDYIWYGNFDVNEAAFAKAQSAFKTINNQL